MASRKRPFLQNFSLTTTFSAAAETPAPAATAATAPPLPPQQQQPKLYNVEEAFRTEEEDDHQQVFELWQRCLQSCWEILTLANDVLSSIMSPVVCREVVYSCRGQRFIQGSLNGSFGCFSLLAVVLTFDYSLGFRVEPLIESFDLLRHDERVSTGKCF